MDELDRQYHEVSQIFPLMQGKEFEELKSDIKANGLIEPIWIDKDGKIIDGRNRHRACIETETPLKFRTYNNGQSLVSFVVSLNLKRRHLDSGQRAALAVNILPMLEAEAKERQLSTLKQNATVPQLIVERGESTEQAAKLFNTNRQYVADAKKMQEQAPDLFEMIKTGEMTIPKAKAEVNKREREAVRRDGIDISVPVGKYQTIVIDPPWQMEKIQREVAPEQVGFEYPTMTLEEIKQFGIPADIADDNCHLFMWTTQKYLPDAFGVLEAWGFKYIFTMVWHKPGGFQPFNLPQYNCEFVLYGRKGSPVFADLKAFPTCFNANRREHSRKPDEFYDLIRRVCDGPRIDIFSREKREGFDQYGNETGKF